jgi:uncharacterized protein (TIGR02444 family)
MPLVSPDSHSSLWDFSLTHYARAGVADACLRLQDAHGVNVNLLLWCAWLEEHGLTLDATRLGCAQKRIHAWDQNYVAPLRQMRRRMKAEFGVTDKDIERVRQQIKQAELLTEKQVQLWLEEIAQHWHPTDARGHHPPATGDNLRFYLQQLNVSDATIAEVVSLLAEGSSAKPD